MVGVEVGSIVGVVVGSIVGVKVGNMVGVEVGSNVGFEVPTWVKRKISLGSDEIHISPVEGVK